MLAFSNVSLILARDRNDKLVQIAPVTERITIVRPRAH